MKKITKRLLTCFGFITLLIGVLLLFPADSIQAEEIDREIFNKTLTDTPHSSELLTLFLVAPHGDAISRTIDIGNTLRSNPLAFHTAIILGFGEGDVKFKVSGNKDDTVLFGSFGTAMGTDEEGAIVFTSDLGYAEGDGEYTLKFSTESFFAAIIVTAPLYPVGYWDAPVTLKLTGSME